MNLTFQTDLTKRKAYLKRIAQNSSSWIIRMICFWVLIIMALGIVFGVCYVLVNSETTPEPATIMIFSLMAICLACIPFFLGLSVKNNAKYKCASPYSGMTNGTLFLTDDYLEFVFWKASREAPAAYSSKRAWYQDENKFIYRFEKNRIKSIKIDSFHVCYVTGEGTLTVPDWASTNDTIETKSAKNFSFVTCFTDGNCENIILKWRDA